MLARVRTDRNEKSHNFSRSQITTTTGSLLYKKQFSVFLALLWSPRREREQHRLGRETRSHTKEVSVVNLRSFHLYSYVNNIYTNKYNNHVRLWWNESLQRQWQQQRQRQQCQ
mmetsp:Transcript_3568/g.8552  ORF Transcript_3568/g.8552 Transcript_3568/m.8552 type:complete len:113 (+) Transcript_3568:299-637(+)